jgi:hypothetical protein
VPRASLPFTQLMTTAMIEGQPKMKAPMNLG